MVKEVLGKVRYTAVLDRCQKGLQCRGVNDWNEKTTTDGMVNEKGDTKGIRKRERKKS